MTPEQAAKQLFDEYNHSGRYEDFMMMATHAIRQAYEEGRAVRCFYCGCKGCTSQPGYREMISEGRCPDGR